MLDSVSFFEIFDFDVGFEIDKKELDKKFYQLQNLFHPDRYENKSDQGLVESSTIYSSFINNGYKILSDDLERAKYVLELRGHKVLAEDEKLTDIELLADIMDTREQIEQASTILELEMHKGIAEEKKENLVR